MKSSGINNTEILSEKNPRELKELDTREVSIVDKPAILREFIITRRLNMGVFDPEKEKIEEPAQKAEEIINEDEKSESQDVVKNETDEEPKNEAILKVYENGDIELEDEKVEKGKRFTPNRISALTKSVQDLLSVLANVDIEATKSIIENINKEIFPQNKVEEVKSLDSEAVKKAVEDVISEKFDSFEKRLDSIEGTRKEAQSKEDPVKESVNKNKSIFSGLL